MNSASTCALKVAELCYKHVSGGRSWGGAWEVPSPLPPYFGLKKIAEGRKASSARKNNHTPVSSRSGSATALWTFFTVCHTGLKFKIVNNFNTYRENIKISLIMCSISTSNKMTGLYGIKIPYYITYKPLKTTNIQYVQKITSEMQLKCERLSFHTQL